MRKLCGLLVVVLLALLASARAVLSEHADPPADKTPATQKRAPATPLPTAPRYQIPKEFIPVDTSRLMGSPDPLPLEVERAFPNLKFERPIELVSPNDGTNRLFVLEQHGTIHVFQNRDGAERTEVFLDIRKQVLQGYEEGLLGLAFHPRFKENGEFYVFYSAFPRASVVVRFRVSPDNPNRADLASEQQVLRVEKKCTNHNGGSLRFGPEGYLYIPLGDGGSDNDIHGNAQNLGVLLGKILRIDVDHPDAPLSYSIPLDNPFVGREGARGEIWAYGLRNIWRMAFDRKTGELWEGDVGQNRFEEINVIRRGGNYGWNTREGFEAFEPNTSAKPADLIDPIVAYDRGSGESVIGGLVYRGKKLRGFDGAYLYGDYVSGNVWTVRWNGKQVTEHRQVVRTGEYITAFGQDAAGEVYICTYDGRLYRLQPRNLDLKAVASRFPRKLSETGLFASVKDNEPAPGMIPYEMNVPFWSDYAAKDRYLALPAKGSIRFDDRERWQFPIGTVFVKTFWMHRDRPNMADPERLETRLLVNSSDGWAGYTYVYNDDRSEAYLLDGSMNKSLDIRTEQGLTKQPYYFPSRNDCLTCHNKTSGFVLGMTTRQMNRTLHYHGDSENQLALLDRLGAFTERLVSPPEKLDAFPDWGFGNLSRDEQVAAPEHPTKPSDDVGTLARAWLDVNCAICHQPRGLAPHLRDMRFHTPLDQMSLVGISPNHGRLSPPDGQLIKPGHPYESEIVFRLGHRGSRQMPPLATRQVDMRGLAIIRQWIAEMPAAKSALGSTP